MSGERFCTQCGAAAGEGLRYCTQCGNAIDQAAPVTADEHRLAARASPSPGPPGTEQASPLPWKRLLWFGVLPLAALAGSLVIVLWLTGSNDSTEEPAGSRPAGANVQQRTPTRSSASAAPSAGATLPPATSQAGSASPTSPAGATVIGASPTSGATAAAGSNPTQAPAAATATPAPTNTPPPTATNTAVPPPNLITGGGFESGALGAPWGTGIYEPNAGGIFWGSADATAEVVQGDTRGAYSLRITNRTAAAPHVYRTLARKVGVSGGQQHCFTAWVRTENGTSGMLSFRFNDSWSQALGIGTGSAAWRQHAYTFVAEDSNIDVRIVSENTGIAWVDDLELTLGACKVSNGAVAPGANPR